MRYSGFCLTNNQDLGLFYTEDETLEETVYKKTQSFNLTEDSFDLLVDRESELEPIIRDDKVIFTGIGKIKPEYHDFFIESYKGCIFVPVLKWFNQPVNTLIVVLSKKFGKPVGVIKTLDDKEI